MKDIKKDAERVRVDLGDRSYDIYIGTEILARTPGFLPFSMEGRGAYIVTDAHVGPLYSEILSAALTGSGARRVETLTLPPGEETKSFSMLEAVTNWILAHEADRRSVVFTLGGGVIGDLAGFAAAITLRGLPYVQIPTTLLAQVDSAVGGKTAIDTPAGKNLVGAFYQPVAVVANIGAIKTLSQREFRAGYAEVVKYGLLGDAAFFESLERDAKPIAEGDEAVLARLVAHSVRAKAAIVQADEREGGARALLNLGHTFGHALELAAGMNGTLLHGEAVSIGMVLAFDLSVRLGLCPAADAERVREHLAAAGLPTRICDIAPQISAGPEDLIRMMRTDKKAEGGQLVFVLVRGIGKAFVDKTAPLEAIIEVLAESFSGKHHGP